MHIGFQCLQLLLVLDAEMLLLVDDQQGKVAKRNRFAEQRMGADDDIDRTVGKALLDPGEFGRTDQPRGLADVDRQALEAVTEGGEMLPRQKRCRHDDCDLAAAHCHHEGGAQGHFRLAETDIAANQPVHRLALGEIIDRRLDRRHLVVGFLVREPRRKLRQQSVLRHDLLRQFQKPRRRGFNQRFGHVADALLQPRLAVLPGDATQFIEIGVRSLRTVARQKLDILNRQEQPVTAGIGELQAVMRRPGRLNCLEPGKAANPVFHVDDEIAGIQARCFR